MFAKRIKIFMKKIIALVYLLFKLCSLEAQTNLLELGPVDKKFSNTNTLEFIGKIGDNYFIDDSKMSMEENKIVMINSQLVKVKEIILSKPKRSFSRFYYIDKYISSNQIIVIFEGTYGNNKIVYAQKLNKNLEVTKDWFEIYTASSIDWLFYFKFKQSNQDILYAVRNFVGENNRNLKASVELAVFDEELTETKRQRIDLGFNWSDYEPYHEEKTNISCIVMDGNVKGKGIFRMIYNIYDDKIHKTIQDIQKSNRHYHTVKYVEDTAENKIYCIGYYRNINENNPKLNPNGNSCDGIFFQAISSISNEIEDEITTDFTEEFKLNFLTAKDLKNGGEIPNHPIHFGAMNKNNEIIIIAEHFEEIKSVIMSSSFSNTPTQRTTTHIYGDIIVTCLNQKGEIKWTRIIPKISSSDYLSGFIYKFVESGVDIVFRDNQDNYNDVVKKKYYTDVEEPFGNVCLVKAHINRDGKLTSDIILDKTNYKTLSFDVFIKQSFFDSDSIILFLNNNMRKYQLGRLRLSTNK